jgi:hypothetical protein
MDWSQIEESIVYDDRQKWDRKALAAELRMAQDGVLEVDSPDRPPGHFTLSELATGQKCQRLGIPVRYYRRLHDCFKFQLANYDFGRLKDPQGGCPAAPTTP